MSEDGTDEQQKVRFPFYLSKIRPYRSYDYREPQCLVDSRLSVNSYI